MWHGHKRRKHGGGEVLQFHHDAAHHLQRAVRGQKVVESTGVDELFVPDTEIGHVTLRQREVVG